MKNPRIATLEKMVARYEKSLADFAAIEEELRMLPNSQALSDALALNLESREVTRRALQTARNRLERERQLEDASRAMLSGETATAAGG